MGARYIGLPLLAALVGCQSSSVSCPEGSLESDGTCRLVCSSNDACLATEVCRDAVCTPEGDNGPVAIRIFRASPPQIAVGGRTTLEWVTTNATGLEIRPQPGRITAAFGSVDVEGLTRPTTFELIATGADGGATSALATVSVGGAPNGEPIITAFDRVPSSGDCQDVIVSWTIQLPPNGTGSLQVTIADNMTGNVLASDDRPTGMATLLLDKPTELVLAATVGDATVTRRLGVAPGLVCDLFVDPDDGLLEGDTTQIRWNTRAATSIQIVDLGTNVTVFERAGPIPDQGFWLVEPAPPVTRYKVIIAGPSGGPPAQIEFDIPVVARPRPPRITQFEITPPIALSASENFDVSWRTVGEASLTLLVDGISRSIEPGASAAQVMVNNGHRISLVATNSDGTIHLERTAFRAVPDGPTNTSPQTAQPIDAPGAVALAIDGMTDNTAGTDDYFSLDLAADAALIRISITDKGTGGCTRFGIDTSLRKPEGGSVTPDYTRYDNGNCPTHNFINAAAGAYFVVVDGGMGSAPYRVVVDATPPSCGDGRIEGAESCDDGNVAPGDACSEVCTIEPAFNFSFIQEGAPGSSLPDTARPVFFMPYAGAPTNSIDDAGFGAIRFLEPWSYFGRRYAGAFVHRDGFVTFRPSTAATPVSFFPIPNPADPNPAIFAFGADLRGGEVVFMNPNAGSVVAAIEWRDIDIVGASGRVSFNATLHDDGSVQLGYPDWGGTNNVADPFPIGLEGPFGRRGFTPPSCAPEGCLGGHFPAPWGLIFRP